MRANSWTFWWHLGYLQDPTHVSQAREQKQTTAFHRDLGAGYTRVLTSYFFFLRPARPVKKHNLMTQKNWNPHKWSEWRHLPFGSEALAAIFLGFGINPNVSHAMARTPCGYPGLVCDDAGFVIFIGISGWELDAESSRSDEGDTGTHRDWGLTCCRSEQWWWIHLEHFGIQLGACLPGFPCIVRSFFKGLMIRGAWGRAWGRGRPDRGSGWVQHWEDQAESFLRFLMWEWCKNTLESGTSCLEEPFSWKRTPKTSCCITQQTHENSPCRRPSGGDILGNWKASEAGGTPSCW